MNLVVEFPTYDLWQKHFGLVDGMAICPHCLKSSKKIYKIPKRYLNSTDLYPTMEYGCEYCIARRAQWRRERRQREYRPCSICGERVHNVRFVATPLCEKCKEVQRLKHAVLKKEKSRVASQNFRANKKGLVADLTLEQWIAILEQHSHLCHYCGEPFSEIDHIVPVSWGGGTTASNVVPSCRACNTKRYRDFVANPYWVFEPQRKVDENTLHGTARQGKASQGQ
jgi:5-methylcytosine-specific restriction endonuclease McrA